jgi:hypothetical protein
MRGGACTSRTNEGETRNAYKILVGRDHSRDLGAVKRLILKMIFE